MCNVTFFWVDLLVIDMSTTFHISQYETYFGADFCPNSKWHYPANCVLSAIVKWWLEVKMGDFLLKFRRGLLRLFFWCISS